MVIGPGVSIADGAVIHSFSHLAQAKLGKNASVGPYARLRPGTSLGDGAKIGNFVETKAAQIDAGAKVNHLTYIGDAHIGTGANIGAGTITCNYDGYFKYRTEIGAGAFIGSNSALVAPVKIGDGALPVLAGVEIHDGRSGAPGARMYPGSADFDVVSRVDAVKDEPAPRIGDDPRCAGRCGSRVAFGAAHGIARRRRRRPDGQRRARLASLRSEPASPSR